jgi:hypothetical protein
VFLLNALGSKCDHTSANGATLGAVSSIFKGRVEPMQFDTCGLDLSEECVDRIRRQD